MRNSRRGVAVGAALLFVAVPLSATPTPAVVGIQHNSGFSITSFTVTGAAVGEFDGAGSFANRSYNGPSTNLSSVDHNSVTINFRHGLTNATNATNGHHESDDENDDDKTESPVPEPGSIVLLGTGLVAMGAFLRRRLWL